MAYFFAPGCATCIPATKQIAQAQRQAGKARFVALNLIPDVSATALRSFLRSAGNPQLPVVKSGVALAQAQQVTALGTTVVYGPDGQEVFRGDDPGGHTGGLVDNILGSVPTVDDVVGGVVAPASADPTTTQSREDGPDATGYLFPVLTPVTELTDAVLNGVGQGG